MKYLRLTKAAHHNWICFDNVFNLPEVYDDNECLISHVLLNHLVGTIALS